MKDEMLSQTLQNELLNHDYLLVKNETAADLVLMQNDQELLLEKKGRCVIRINVREFLASSGAWLALFSREADRERFFRKITLISLLIGFPLFLYLVVYGILFIFVSLVFPAEKSPVAATLLAFAAGIVLFLLFFFGRTTIHGVQQVDPALQSGDWRMRVAALKFIHYKGLDAARYPAYRNLMQKASVPEKYWLANALGAGRETHTFKDLLSLLDDPHPNVVSAAFRAFGKRKDPAGIRPILTKLTTSKDWYSQWNAYKALRALGWKQSISR
ncbi:MAG: HEAT repeat domain-containing protein [Deltaproteobacteria bacterium]|nr:HEAT repeat domain-containing protein [Deltaproteobacteria bacterium]